MTIKESLRAELINQGIDYQILNKKSDSLQRTYLIAAKAITKTKKEGYISVNYMSRPRKESEAYRYSLEEYKEAEKNIDEQRDELMSQLGTFKNNFESSLWEAEVIKKSRFGNCDEMASALFFYLYERLDPNIPLEKVGVIGGDHVFLVIGRAQNSLIEDPTTWGEEAIIVDPWSHALFSAKEFFDRNVALDGHTRGVPNLRKFDPSTDRLSVLTSRFQRSSEIKTPGIIASSLKAHLPVIKELLDNLHKITALKDKETQAEKILDYLKNHSIIQNASTSKTMPLKDLSSFTLLYDQMVYFNQMLKGKRVYPSRKHPDFPAFKT